MRTTWDEEEEMEEEWVVALFPRHHPVHFANDRTQVKVSGREQQPRLSPRLGWRERGCVGASSFLQIALVFVSHYRSHPPVHCPSFDEWSFSEETVAAAAAAAAAVETVVKLVLSSERNTDRRTDRQTETAIVRTTKKHIGRQRETDRGREKQRDRKQRGR